MRLYLQVTVTEKSNGTQMGNILPCKEISETVKFYFIYSRLALPNVCDFGNTLGHKYSSLTYKDKIISIFLKILHSRLHK